jgi:hypothetical protein
MQTKLLLIPAILLVLTCSPLAIADEIVVVDADNVWDLTLDDATDIGRLVGEPDVMVVKYADTLSYKSLENATDVSRLVGEPGVMVVRYADVISYKSLDNATSVGRLQGEAHVIAVKYADSINYIDLHTAQDVAPKLTITASMDAVLAGETTDVLFTVTESGTPIDGAEINLSGAATGNGITDADGHATISITAEEGVITATAMKRSYSGDTVKITSSTTAPLTVVITSPLDGTTTTQSTITISGTASSPDGIASVTVNGILATGTTEWSANITLVDGTNTIVVIATDNAGNSKEASVTVTLDTTAPVITHTPVISATESVPIPISATITDSNGIASATLFYRITGATWTSLSMTASGNTYTASIPASSVTTAGVEYYIRAMDSNSNTAYSPATAPAMPYSITVTSTPGDGSSIITISAEPETINLSESVTISGNIIPAHSAIVTLTFTSPTGTTIEQPVLSTISGAYRFVLPANEVGPWLVNAAWAGDADHAGNTSETIPFNVTSTEIDVGYAIIIVGRNDEGLSQPYIDLTANGTYKTLLKRGFTAERICYLNPSAEQDANGDGVSDVDMISSLTNVSYAINTWAEGNVSVDVPLLIYMADHGGSDTFLVNGAANILTASDLNSYLDQLTADTGCHDIVVVYEACSSGSFVDDLSNTGRIIVTSTGIDADAGIDNTGAFFSKYFFKGISDGKAIKEAFEDASNAPEIIAYSQLLVSFGLSPQTPLLDDNGDATGHAIPLAGTGDGSLAASRYIGTQWGALDFPPTITGSIQNQKVVVDTDVNIWAVVVDDSVIEDVYATIIEPSYNISCADDTLFEMNLTTLHLQDPDADGNYTASFTPTESGNYTVIIHATDSGGGIASPKQCTITSTMLGDVNGNDELTSDDAVLTLQLAASGQYNNAADVNRDGSVTSLDALMIMQACAGKMVL